MPRTNRSDNFYISLPEELATPSVPDVKMSISVTITYPKGLDKQAQNTVTSVIAESSDVFKMKMKKAIKKKLGG